MKNGRCRMHGGKSTGAARGNINAMKHGWFSNVILPGERELFELAKEATIDDEILVIRVSLHRLVKLSGGGDLASLIDGAIDAAYIRGDHYDAATKSKVPYDKLEIKASAPVYADLIIKAVDAIRKLLLARWAIEGPGS